MLPSAGEYTNLLQVTARVPLKRSGSHSTCLEDLEAFAESVLSVLCQKKILLNTFLDVLMADPPPQYLVWLPLMHRLANVENGTCCDWRVVRLYCEVVFNDLFPIAHYVWTPHSQNMTKTRLANAWNPLCWCPTVFHPVECSYCRSESMMGFRYRCQQCHGYQLCQSCFWRGHASGPHSNQHQMKEHSSWVRTITFKG